MIFINSTQHRQYKKIYCTYKKLSSLEELKNYETVFFCESNINNITVDILPNNIKKIIINDYEQDKEDKEDKEDIQNLENKCIIINKYPEQLEEIDYNSTYINYINTETLKYKYMIIDLPITLKKLKLSGINYKIDLSKLVNLEKLSIHANDMSEFDFTTLPNNLKKLNISYKRNKFNINSGKELIKINLPKSLIDLSIEYLDNEININELENLEKLKIEGYYKYDLINLPSKLKYINLSYGYNNKIIGHVPDLIEEMEIHNFNNINNFPINLKKLLIRTLASYNNIQPIILFEGIEELSIPYSIYKVSCNYFPKSLKKLKILDELNTTGREQINLNNLPENLELLNINITCDCDLSNLPSKLETLVMRKTFFNSSLNNLPSTIKYLDIYNISNDDTYDTNKTKFLSHLPYGIKEIRIHKLYNYNLDNLPTSVEKLYIDFSESNINSVIDLSYLINLKYLNFSYKFNSKIIFPQSLEILILEGIFNSPLENLPKGLKILSIDSTNNFNNFNQKLNLPDSLKNLYLRNFNQYIITKINNGLEKLFLNIDFDMNHDLLELPSTLKLLSFTPINYQLHYDKLRDYINNFPDSIETLVFCINDFNNVHFNKLPNNIKEIGFESRHLCNSNFNFIDHMKSNGVCANFNQIHFDYVEDASDIKAQRNIVKKSINNLDDPYTYYDYFLQ